MAVLGLVLAAVQHAVQVDGAVYDGRPPPLQVHGRVRLAAGVGELRRARAANVCTERHPLRAAALVFGRLGVQPYCVPGVWLCEG